MSFRKLIGARIFNKNYMAQVGKLDPALRSARDFVGHGTHTLSTAGGNFVGGADVFGNGNGTAKGGSPRARVVAYKACWHKMGTGGCQDADILAAFDYAIYDGVDVISTSVGPSDPYMQALLTDGISIGAFHAVARNIVVVSSAGNNGPSPLSVTNVAPWMFTVAASTTDRDFLISNISLGYQHYIKEYQRMPPSSPTKKFYPMINSFEARLPHASIDDARLCKPGTLDPTKVRGKILVCLRGNKLTSASQIQQGHLAGAVSVLVRNDKDSGNVLLAENHVLPAASISGTQSNSYNNHGGKGKHGKNNTESVASLIDARTYIQVKAAPIIAGFSSRGPSAVQPLILKPDITAPGVNVIAAFTQASGPSNLPSDSRRVLFNVQHGTSMACSHVAGVAGLLKTYYPNWSPAAIKSAIMTTATTLDNTNQPIRDTFDKVAIPFDYGAGHIQPNLAIDPGLVYDLSTTDYLNFLCASGYDKDLLKLFANLKSPYTCPKYYRMEDFNYPSITVHHPRSKVINVTRTVTNVGPPSTYVANTHGPKGIMVLVQPSSLTFKKTREKKKFQVILQANGVPRHRIPSFGTLSWTDGKHRVTSPIVVL